MKIQDKFASRVAFSPLTLGNRSSGVLSHCWGLCVSLCICVSVCLCVSFLFPFHTQPGSLTVPNRYQCKTKHYKGSKERDMGNTYVHAPGKGPFSQMKPTADKVIFLSSSFIGKLKLVIHCCFCIRLTSVSESNTVHSWWETWSFCSVSCWCFISSKPRKPR